MSKNIKGHERYSILMTKWAEAYIRPYFDSKQKGEKAKDRDHTFNTRLFGGYMEIVNTVRALKLAEIFISLPTPKSKKIDRIEYIKYHVDKYLEENYILKERLISYAKKLSRAYKKTQRSIVFQKKVNPMLNMITRGFEDILKARGRHVHSFRYDDEDLLRLGSLGFIS